MAGLGAGKQSLVSCLPRAQRRLEALDLLKHLNYRHQVYTGRIHRSHLIESVDLCVLLLP